MLVAVYGEVFGYLNTFRSIEHWNDRVTNIKRVRALWVIRRALASAQKQYSQLDWYTQKSLSTDGLPFDNRIGKLSEVLGGQPKPAIDRHFKTGN
jgi:hypothetical protein